MTIKVHSFETNEEFMARVEEMRGRHRLAFEMSLEEQRAIKAGDRYVRIEEDGFPIFGIVQVPADSDDQVLLEMNPEVRLVRAFSQGCPEGEFGTENVGIMIPISEDIFIECLENGWEPTASLQDVVDTFWEKMETTMGDWS